MICHACKQDLPETDFSPGMLKYSSPSRHICRKCKNELTKKYLRDNPDKRREYDDRYEAKRKERRKARLAVTCAVRHRGFERKPCQVCGSDDGVQGHHISYLEEDWLTVVWLCPICHKAVHAGRIDISGLRTYTAPPIEGRWGELAVNK